ncbi:zinc finger protein ZFP2-like isoform X2 [Plodia interpunctella]|uniref:zinc finger protein ZFP2-like isoform X2 n=1 Tax=Plodia interpunctella TaxID=58824 RepID=UPI002368222F|nr:zinc finger protein ZFP2-like isoform X2 [Plodia interpunctella]
MANVKSRPKAPKSASTKKGCGKNVDKSTGDDAKDVKKSKHRQSTVDKVPQVVNVDLDESTGKTRKSGRNDHFSISKDSLLTKSGRIKRKSKDHLKLFDNILKSELMIQDSKQKKNEAPPTVNNNEIGISNQNETETSAIQTAVINSNKKNSKKKKEKQINSVPKNKPADDTKQIILSTGSLLTLPVFECHYCGKTFTTKTSMRRHIYVHMKIKRYECVKCLRQFSHKVNHQLHIRRRHPELYIPKSYVCQICDKVFRLKESLSSHLDVHIHKYGSFKCLYCTESFSDQEQLVFHKKTKHLSSTPLDCHICDEHFKTQLQLAQHIKEHLKLKGFICQYCGKEYKELSSMRRHVQVSHGGRRVQCPICNKKLKGHLSEHMRVHEKRRPHECPECGQRFTQSTQLNVHRRAHTGDRPYPCRICNRRFSHSNALMLHIRRHTGEKPFPCAMCPTYFSQLPHMKAHMRNIHGKANAYKCSKCGQFFKLKVQLESHEKGCVSELGQLSVEEKDSSEELEGVDSSMTLSRMRYLLALLLTMIASEDKLKYLANICQVSGEVRRNRG